MIGQMNSRVTLQYPTRVSDAMGGFTETWTDADTVWAKKTPHRSDEAVQAMATTGSATYNFRLRWRRGVRASWRLKEGTSYFNILGPPMRIQEGPGRQWLDITAREVR